MHDKDTVHYDDSDYPVAVTCGACGHQFPIDPCTEEGLKTIKDPVHGGRVNVSCCPRCEPEYYEELQAREEEAARIEDARLAEAISPGLLANLEKAARGVSEKLEEITEALREGDVRKARDLSYGLTNMLGCASWYAENSKEAPAWFVKNYPQLITPPL